MVSNAVVMIPLIFLAVLIHEMMHGVMFYLFGYPVSALNLGLPLAPMKVLGYIHYTQAGVHLSFPVNLSPWLLGASVESSVDADKIPPLVMAAITVVGPVINLVMAMGLIVAGVFRGTEDQKRGLWNFWERVSDFGPIRSFLMLFALWNLGLGVFNILPVYPLDGGWVFIGLWEAIFGPMSTWFYHLYTSVGLAFVLLAILCNFVFLGKFFLKRN